MRISDWSSDVCSSDLLRLGSVDREAQTRVHVRIGHAHFRGDGDFAAEFREHGGALLVLRALAMHDILEFAVTGHRARSRSEEHTSELQSLMRISYAVFCLKKKQKDIT